MTVKHFSGAALMILAAGLFVNLSAQPKLSNPGAEKLCSVDTAQSFQSDTVVSAPDENGFRSIFDGTSFKGWWQNCLSSHSSDKTKGAIFRVDSDHHAIYAMSRNGDGGLLSTHKRYAHYELMFMWWPQFGNDGGVFNRYSITSGNNVASNQMVLDYLGASGILSYYSEEGFPGSRNGRPWSYNSATSVTIPGSGGGAGSGGTPDINDWTQSTRTKNLITNYTATDYGCASTGCTQADYLRLWNGNGWMQIREIYYGGLTTNQPANVTSPGDKIHEFTFFRKHYPLNDTNLTTRQLLNDTAKWIGVVQDSMVLTSSQVTQYQRVNPFAFQVHSGSRYIYESNGGKGSWYADIKVRELDESGRPVEIVTVAKDPAAKQVKYDLQAVSGALVGSMELDHLVNVSDLQGRVLQEYTGFAGAVHHDLPAYDGIMLVKISTTRGNQVLRVKGSAR